VKRKPELIYKTKANKRTKRDFAIYCQKKRSTWGSCMLRHSPWDIGPCQFPLHCLQQKCQCEALAIWSSQSNTQELWCRQMVRVMSESVSEASLRWRPCALPLCPATCGRVISSDPETKLGGRTHIQLTCDIDSMEASQTEEHGVRCCSPCQPARHPTTKHRSAPTSQEKILHFNSAQQSQLCLTEGQLDCP
jgi:hypothetical protein